MNLIKPIVNSPFPSLPVAKNNHREIYRGYRDEKDSPFKMRKEEREREMRKEAISRHRNKPTQRAFNSPETLAKELSAVIKVSPPAWLTTSITGFLSFANQRPVARPRVTAAKPPRQLGALFNAANQRQQAARQNWSRIPSTFIVRPKTFAPIELENFRRS